MTSSGGSSSSRASYRVFPLTLMLVGNWTGICMAFRSWVFALEGGLLGTSCWLIGRCRMDCWWVNVWVIKPPLSSSICSSSSPSKDSSTQTTLASFPSSWHQLYHPNCPSPSKCFPFYSQNQDVTTPPLHCSLLQRLEHLEHLEPAYFPLLSIFCIYPSSWIGGLLFPFFCCTFSWCSCCS